MSSGAIVTTAADAGYFPLLQGLIQSLLDRRGAQGLAGAALGVIDLGLEPWQTDWLQARAVILAAPRRDLLPPRPAGRPEMAAMGLRVFLPEHFPGFGLYVWIDADAWVQTPEPVPALLAGAAEEGFAVVAEDHPAYGYLAHAGLDHPVREMHHLAYRGLFGQATADALMAYPVVNSGVFAVAAGAPQLAVWRDCLAFCYARPLDFFLEQGALNFALASGRLGARRLPARLNWVCAHALPALDPGRGLFVDPLAPHAPIGICHLTSVKDLRVPVPLAGGGVHPGLSLRYGEGWDWPPYRM